MSSSTSDAPELGPPRVEEVSDGIYAYVQPDGSWYINNTGFLVGRRGVVSVDGCSTVRRTRAYLDAIAGVSSAPVTTLVNTHHHGDHTYGNALFVGATVVAHETCRDELLAAGLPRNTGLFDDVGWGEVELAPPFLTYTDRVTLWVDELRTELLHVGAPAHTTNDSVLWVPDRSVLFAGDLLFEGGTPFLLMGSVSGALSVLEEVVGPLGAQTLVPGHGGVCGPDLIATTTGYLRFVQATAARGREAGLTALETARETDLGEYAGWLDPERIVGNLHRAYAELDGRPRGEAIDVVAALTDMVAYNGGRPLTCRA
jgi:cyclase